MRVDVVASMPHYRAHLLPIFECLPPELQGRVQPMRPVVDRPHYNHVALVASWQDVKPLRGRCRMIYVEHGAGQTYAGDERSMNQPGYSGSGGFRHNGVIGFIAPSQHVADRWKTAPAVAVGCPKMDEYIGLAPTGPPAVCFAFHWDTLISPEARSAYQHYADSLPEIMERYKQQGFEVYGHAHPKWEGQLDRTLLKAGAKAILNDDRAVFHTSSVLFVDNSSLAYEFAALGRPVVSLNAPWYRRDVEHGLRFWSHIPGIHVDGPEELLTLNVWDLVYNQLGENNRVRSVEHVYAFMDGSSSQRAATFIAERLATM